MVKHGLSNYLMRWRLMHGTNARGREKYMANSSTSHIPTSDKRKESKRSRKSCAHAALRSHDCVSDGDGMHHYVKRRHLQ
jgi:hypothetical protein